MSRVSGEPILVTRRGPYQGNGLFGWHPNVEVADFSEDERPAYRVACHCRNCNWRGEARARVGEKWPLWLTCPKCETYELSAHGEFMGRDEMTRDEEAEKNRQEDERAAEIRKRQTDNSWKAPL